MLDQGGPWVGSVLIGWLIRLGQVAWLKRGTGAEYTCYVNFQSHAKRPSVVFYFEIDRKRTD